MGLLDVFRAAADAPLTEAERSGYEHTIGLLEADLHDLERALFEPGWQRLSTGMEQEFSRDGLRQIAQLSRVMRLKNPLCRRASAVKTFYVWGQGVEVSAKDDAVTDVVRGLVEDPGNQAALFGPSAREAKEAALHTDGNVFLALFAHPRTGRVQVRTIRFDEVHALVKNPEDAADPWFYLRRWWQTEIDPVTGQPRTTLHEALFPDIDYRPRVRPARWGKFDIRWDTPLLHVHVNRQDGWDFGVPELYPALDWARAHSEYLDDFRRLVKVMAKLAWQLKTKGSQLGRAKKQMAAATDVDAPAGQTLVTDHGAGELVPLAGKAGVSVAPADHRHFALMVSAATDIPETMLLGDPSTGNLATAKTLDRPTELAMETRRQMWGAVITRLCDHAIDAAVTAPSGPLSGLVERDEFDRLAVTLRGAASRTVNVDWPPLQERDMAQVISALAGSAAGAAALPGMPDDVLLRLALVALDVDDVDEVVQSAMDRLEEERDAASNAQAEQAGELGETLRSLREAIGAAGG